MGLARHPKSASSTGVSDTVKEGAIASLRVSAGVRRARAERRRRGDERGRVRHPGALLPDPGHPGHHGLPPLRDGVALPQAQGQEGRAGAAARACCRASRSSCRSTTRCTWSTGCSRRSRRSATRRTCSRSRCSTTRPTRPPAIASRAVEHYRAQGFDIHYLHRSDRTGFKAGALDAGLERATGEFVLIFDADFVAPPDDPRADARPLRRPEGRDGAGALGPHQPRLLAAHRGAVDHARRPLHPRARRPQPLGPLLQLQRHRGHLAPQRDRATPAAGSTTRSPRTSTSATARR